MLEPGGELVAITPRSFCNGPYFRRFRIRLLDMMSLRRIHVFESRKKAFGDDDVLQENVIYHAIRGEQKPERVIVSSSEGVDFDKASSRSVPYEHVVLPGDRDAFIRLVLNDSDDSVMERMRCFCDVASSNSDWMYLQGVSWISAHRNIFALCLKMGLHRSYILAISRMASSIGRQNRERSPMQS